MDQSYQRLRYYFFFLFFLLLDVLILVSGTEDPLCDFHDLSPPVHTVLCAVEKGVWRISPDAPALQNTGCLIGKNRCKEVMAIPKEEEVPPSPAPPDAKNPTYQQLALRAEEVVPKTWWRAGFANDKLHLSVNNDALPRRLFDSHVLSNKKLKNIYQCVTRQQFMRKSASFNDHQPVANNQTMTTKTSCKVASSGAMKTFRALWQQYRDTLDGRFDTFTDGTKVWTPRGSEDGAFYMAAAEVLENFYVSHGGIWTGCFAFEEDIDCRGALAAAVLVLSMQTIADITRKRTFTESQFTRGYILASLGRGLLHGDASSSGNKPTTPWQLRAVDFVALQSAYMRLYIDSFGAKYREQLDHYIPLAFTPGFVVQSPAEWKPFANRLEPVYTSLRNWMFTECANLIDFGPYRPLVAFSEVRQALRRASTSRRVLVDVGANGFFASPKYLIDSYAPYLPFTDIIMIEPEPHFSATIPPVYSRRYNITFLPIYAEVNTGGKTDMLRLLPTLVRPEDFVVLKFDVDPNRYAYGPTMEWGFLFATLQRPEIAALVDELYIELHFHFPALYWKHYHSNWEALDAFRDLRNQGAIVHSWP